MLQEKARHRIVKALITTATLLQPSCGQTQSASVPRQQTSNVASGEATQPQLDPCPYSTSFQQLRSEVANKTSTDALLALYRYAALPANDSNEACQAMALDAEINSREASSVTLHFVNGRSVPAQVSYRCQTVVAVTTACNGAVEDGTARPFSAGLVPITLRASETVTIDSVLPDAKLIGVYRLRVADLLDGGRATPLPAGQPLVLAPGKSLMALIAIYSAPPPWRYRKIVWYYQ